MPERGLHEMDRRAAVERVNSDGIADPLRNQPFITAAKRTTRLAFASTQTVRAV